MWANWSVFSPWTIAVVEVLVGSTRDAPARLLVRTNDVLGFRRASCGPQSGTEETPKEGVGEPAMLTEQQTVLSALAVVALEITQRIQGKWN